MGIWDSTEIKQWDEKHTKDPKVKNSQIERLGRGKWNCIFFGGLFVLNSAAQFWNLGNSKSNAQEQIYNLPFQI